MSTFEFNTQLDLVSAYLRIFALSLTRDNELAGDLYQDTVFKALRHKDKFQIGTNFKAWITTIMRNTFINDRRRVKIAKTEATPFDSTTLVSNAGSVSNIAESDMSTRELRAMVETLPQNLNQPFMMNFYGYAYQEIADELGIPLGTVKSRIFFARKQLQNMVLSRYPDMKFRLKNNHVEDEHAA